MNLLSFKKTKQLFKKHNISIKGTGLFEKKQDALIYANKIGFPVVLKVYSDKVIHKTEENAVITNIQNNKEFKESFTFLDQKFKDKKVLLYKNNSREGNLLLD